MQLLISSRGGLCVKRRPKFVPLGTEYHILGTFSAGPSDSLPEGDEYKFFK